MAVGLQLSTSSFDQQRIANQFGLPDPYAIETGLQPEERHRQQARRDPGQPRQGIPGIRPPRPHRVHTFDTLEPKTKRYGDFPPNIPERFTTQIDIDTAHAHLQVDRLRAYAGRHINAQLAIELPGRGNPSLDGVRRP